MFVASCVINERWISYLLVNYDSYLFNCAVELVQGHCTLVVDVKKLESLRQVTLLVHILWAFLGNLGAELCLEASVK